MTRKGVQEPLSRATLTVDLATGGTTLEWRREGSSGGHDGLLSMAGWGEAVNR